MAYTTPRDLDGFIPFLSKPDTRLKLQVGNDLLIFLAEPSNSIVCQDIGMLVDGLIPWMQSSNFKVSSHGIDVLTCLIDRLGHDFRPYLQTVLPNVIDRLGDAKDTVREKAQILIFKLLERNTLTPQLLLEKLSPGFSHKNAKIREEALRCLCSTISEHGITSLSLSGFIPVIAKLLSDPASAVRDTAFSTLVELYKHLGEKLRADLMRRNLVPQTKWPTLTARFDEARDGGELLPTATRSAVESAPMDEVDRQATTVSRIALSAKKVAGLGTGTKARTVCQSAPPGGGAAGSLDEEFFRKSFEDVPTVRIFSPREVTDHLKSIQDIISDQSNDWNKRVEALKKIRSLVIAEATSHEEFFVGLKQLDLPLQATLRDLRSQVVREGCITVAFLAEMIGNKFERTIEMLMVPLINLIQNSAKIMASSGIVTIKIIIQNIQSPRLIPIITNNAATSKSKDIRRSCCNFLDYILNNWPSHSLERYVALLQEAVKKGVADADPEARVSARKAFRGFRDNFPEQAEALLQSLEPSYRRALQGEGVSASSSNSNLSSGFKTPKSYGRPVGTSHSAAGSGGRGGGFRSNSAIDLQAAQRAKARAQYAAVSRNKVAYTASLPRPKKSPDSPAQSSTQSPERLGRTRNRNSQSQPTSRSGSPSSRLAYLYHHRASVEQDSPSSTSSLSRPRRSSGGISRSTTGSRDASRETSPTRPTLGRLGMGGARRSGGSGVERPPLSPASRPVLAQKILQQSREAENALADVFNEGDHYRMPKKSPHKSLDNHSDESETSSVCSERSFDSYRRPSDSYSWSGSQQRLPIRDLWEPCRDIEGILLLCSSTIWQERKDGLISLQHYLTSESPPLTPGELKYLTEIFTKMFMDAHTKGLSVFLDTLHEVIRIRHDDLHFWTYVLLQRVFLKLGTETLNSVHSKLMSTLDIIRAHFPADLLISNVCRFILDATQTPSAKVKITVLNFLTELLNTTEVEVGQSKAVLEKILTFAHDTKSAEVRNAAKTCVVAMWNAMTSQMAKVLPELRKDLQDVARAIVQTHMRKNSTGSEPLSPLNKTLMPIRSDGIDQEEVYRNLRKTTAEIQNYSYEAPGSNHLDRDRDTTSQDSGISQMSLGNDFKIEGVTILEEKVNEHRLGYNSLPPYATTVAHNGVGDSATDGGVRNDNNFRSLGDLNEVDMLRNMFEKCLVDYPSPPDEKQKLLVQLAEMIRQGHSECIRYIIENFKKLLRILIDHLNQSNTNCRVVVLEILAAIFQNEQLRSSWVNFVELITIRVVQAHHDDKREVTKAAEATAAAMGVCPFNTVVKTLIPLIETDPYPRVLGAIKMLTILVDCNPSDVTDEHLAKLMPALIKLSDHAESPVRKSSIFCMVALHKAVGDDRLSSYIGRMSGSKVKLLRLYITRSGTSALDVPPSPKNHPAATTS